jgi:murein DD-endopeptidase MepM/ murein hydrolase activator NlpD
MTRGSTSDYVLYGLSGAIVGAIITLSANKYNETVSKLDVDYETAASFFLENSITPISKGNQPLSLPALNFVYQKNEVNQLQIKKGDTLSSLLNPTGASSEQIEKIITSIQKVFNPRLIRPGQNIQITTNKDGAGKIHLDSFRIELDGARKIIAFKSDRHGYIAKEVRSKFLTQTQRFNGRINSSFYESASSLGVPTKTIIAMSELFSYNIDFQRDVRKNDGFQVMLEQKTTLDGTHSLDGEIDYAAMTIKGKTHTVYAYRKKNTVTKYYHENGEGVRKALMRTPINGARLSSTFGKRKHPILGYTKMHKGVDFAAPRGTPIMAAGDGVIKKMKYWGNYGKFIQIEHSNGFSTNYAHLSKFFTKQKVGDYVKQGSIIGYVGTTGRSTGPHLHYEVMQNGININPRKLRSFSSEKITGPELKTFHQHIAIIQERWAKPNKKIRLASLMKKESLILNK